MSVLKRTLGRPGRPRLVVGLRSGAQLSTSFFEDPDLNADAERAIESACGTTALPNFDKLFVGIKNVAIRFARRFQQEAEECRRERETLKARLKQSEIEKSKWFDRYKNAEHWSNFVEAERDKLDEKADVAAKHARIASLARSALHQITLRPHMAKQLAARAIEEIDEHSSGSSYDY